MRDSEGLTWGRAGGGQLVLAPEPFVEVQGQWDPGVGWERVTALAKPGILTNPLQEGEV